MCIKNRTATKIETKATFQRFNALSLNAPNVAIEFKAEGKKTPKEGYKSITVKTEVYDYYYRQWLKVKDEYSLKGIRSFSAYITHILFDLMEQEKTKNPNI